MSLTTILFLLAIIIVVNTETMNFILLLPIDTEVTDTTVNLEIQTFDLSEGAVDLKITSTMFNTTETFQHISEVKLEFGFKTDLQASYGSVHANTIHIQLIGIFNIDTVTLKARINQQAAINLHRFDGFGTLYKVTTFCEILGNCIIGFASPTKRPVGVTITLPQNNGVSVEVEGSIKNGGETFSVSLSNRQSMYLRCVRCDLTNTLLESTSPITVFAGSQDTFIRKGHKESTMFTQMPPVASWGKQFIALNLGVDEGGDIIRIVSRFDNTQVHIDGSQIFEIQSNQWIQRMVTKNGLLYISANKPIMVVQLIYDGINHASTILIPPIEQFTDASYSFSCYDILLIQMGNSVVSLTINGMESSNTKIVPMTGLIVSELVANSSNSVCRVQSDGSQFVIAYKATGGNSYLDANYIGRNMLKDINVTSHKPMEPGDLVDNDGDGDIDEDDCTSANSPTGFLNEDGKDCKVEGSGNSMGTWFFFPVWPISRDSGIVTIEPIIDLSKGEVSEYIQGERQGTTTFSNSIKWTKTFGDGFPNQMTVIEVTSQTDMAVHMYLKQNGNGINKGFSSIVYPFDALGLDYFAASYCPSDCESFCVVTAAFNNTEIKFIFQNMNISAEIKLTNETLSVQNKLTETIVLGKYQYAMLKSRQDLSGTYIRGSNKISVICGSDFEKFAIGEQLWPINLYRIDETFNIFQLYDTVGTNVVRVMASDSLTTCRIYDSQKSTTFFHYIEDPGNYLELNLKISPVLTIRCYKAVFVWNVITKNNESGFMILHGSSSQYYYSQSFYSGALTDATQKIYVYKTSSNFPLTYLGRGSTETKGYVVDLQESIDYSVTTTHGNITFFLWNIAMNNIVTNNGHLFGSQVFVQWPIRQICSLGITADDDCDGHIDEDRCTLIAYNFDPEKYHIQRGKYLPDYDIDGNYDEDCDYQIPDCFEPQIPFTTVNDYNINAVTLVTNSFSQFTCQVGYTKPRSIENIVCYADGNWTPEMVCLKDCEDPTLSYNNSVLISGDSRAVESNVTMGCKAGFTLVGTDVLICDSNSTWTSYMFECMADCADPTMQYDNSRVIQSSSWAFGSSVQMGCDVGFSLLGNDTLICGDNSTWSTNMFLCIDGCPNPGNTTANLVVLHPAGTKFFPIGITVTMSCNGPSTLVGSRQITCDEDSQWNDTVKCVPDCGNPAEEVQVPNAVLEFTVGMTTAYNTSFTFTCKRLFKLVGEGSIKCLENSTWSQPEFHCEACWCPCRLVGTPRYTEITEKTIQSIYAETDKKLAVREKELSAYIRTITCAPNKLQKEKSIGYFGIILLVLSVGSIVLLDITTLVNHLKHAANFFKLIFRRIFCKRNVELD